MELIRLTDHVGYTMFSRESDRPVLGYVHGQRYSLMVDADNSKKHVELFHEAVRNKGLRKPDFVAITHWHWDHTFVGHAEPVSKPKVMQVMHALMER